MDYSQNIALKPKHEVQSAHFSGKEQTLHCTVLAERVDKKNICTIYLMTPSMTRR